MHKAARRRRQSPVEVDNKLARITTTLDYSGFGLADLVIEAVVERMDVKQRVLHDLESEVREDCILATNTSALSVTEMASALRDPGRLAGMHFFNPVHRMPLVEVIVSSHTRPATVATVVALARKLGKTPIVVRDAPGFLVNRILAPFMNEASVLFEEGQDVLHLDRAMRSFGMPMGPFELIDEVGADVACEAGRTLHAGLGERMRPAALAARLVDARRLGRKTGSGMYRYAGKRRRPDRALWPTLRDRGAAPPLPPSVVQERVFSAMINEAARCLDEGIVATAADLDLALVFGIGFPPFRGGLLRYADAQGIDTVVRGLERLENDVGPRFAPCSRLRRMADVGETFHGGR
jgi:3-hydroxyacyl-CoA dehydrogenase/enoyl-CoA hydratase/3-hydroxybutyryl-CoA epimerase